jgi:hypothetical protein
LNSDVNDIAFLAWPLFWQLFPKIGKFFSNHLVTLLGNTDGKVNQSEWRQ